MSWLGIGTNSAWPGGSLKEEVGRVEEMKLGTDQLMQGISSCAAKFGFLPSESVGSTEDFK